MGIGIPFNFKAKECIRRSWEDLRNQNLKPYRKDKIVGSMVPEAVN